MKYFIDFEMVQPQEIITQVGIKAESGETFFAYVVDDDNDLNPIISDFLGYEIGSADAVFSKLFSWIIKTSNEKSQFYFWSAKGDCRCIAATMKKCRTSSARFIMTYIMNNAYDYQKEFAERYNNGNAPSLSKASSLLIPNLKQKHNALEDAALLYLLYACDKRGMIGTAEVSKKKKKIVVTATPKTEKKKVLSDYPSGTICFLEPSGCGVEKAFSHISEAVMWIVETYPEYAEFLPKIRARINESAVPGGHKYLDRRWRKVF